MQVSDRERYEACVALFRELKAFDPEIMADVLEVSGDRRRIGAMLRALKRSGQLAPVDGRPGVCVMPAACEVA